MNRNPEALKRAAAEAIDAARLKVLTLAEEIYRHPELGYKEEVTAGRVAAALADLGLAPRTGIALTGVRAEAQGRSQQAKVALLGELDAVICFDHPAADPATGAAHACGHHLQLGAAYGALTGLVRSGVLDELDGSVAFLAVPAEEGLEHEFRLSLARAGRIRFFGGKQEFLRLGEFDDLDAVLMVHADSAPPAGPFARLTRSSNGFLVKRARFVGKEAHAGAFPWEGVNALNACLLGLMGIHAQRETFRDEDLVRVHPIITRGGDAINVVPADVRLETYVRAANLAAIRATSAKVSRALQGGALSVGAQLELENFPGYLPLEAEPTLNRLFGENAGRVEEGYHQASSTDAGDVSQYRPTIQPLVGGVRGKIHTREFAVVDPEVALLWPAKVLAATVIDLLWDGARKAREVRQGFQPRFTREGYEQLWADLCLEKA